MDGEGPAAQPRPLFARNKRNAALHDHSKEWMHTSLRNGWTLILGIRNSLCACIDLT